MFIVVPPVINRPPLSTRVTEGDTARFDCSFTGTPFPHTRTAWLREQRPVNVRIAITSHPRSRLLLHFAITFIACSVCIARAIAQCQSICPSVCHKLVFELCKKGYIRKGPDSRFPHGKRHFEGDMCNIPMHECIVHCSPAALGVCACPAHAEDECIRRREE